jgi:hypothetical protein
MRGEDRQQQELFLYGSLEEFVLADHPLRPIRAMVDEALERLDDTFDEIYRDVGRPSIAPERLLRAQLLMLLYTIRSERMLARSVARQPAVPVVRGAGDEREGLAGDGVSARTGTGCWRGTWRGSSLPRSCGRRSSGV